MWRDIEKIVTDMFVCNYFDHENPYASLDYVIKSKEFYFKTLFDCSDPNYKKEIISFVQERQDIVGASLVLIFYDVLKEKGVNNEGLQNFISRQPTKVLDIIKSYIET